MHRVFNKGKTLYEMFIFKSDSVINVGEIKIGNKRCK